MLHQPDTLDHDHGHIHVDPALRDQAVRDAVARCLDIVAAGLDQFHHVPAQVNRGVRTTLHFFLSISLQTTSYYFFTIY